jgi:hypothetical protein
MGLSDRDQAILRFEGSWWTERGTKEAGIRARLGLSPSRYRQILARLVDCDDAESADPLLIRRLRRDRDRRRRGRLGGGTDTDAGGNGPDGGRRAR